jgi:hypothetical protein
VASPEELVEFTALSAKVANRSATEAERARWRELRQKLASPPPVPIDARPGALPRAHTRRKKKLRVRYSAERELERGFADELGGGGLRIVTSSYHEIGTRFVLSLDLAGADDPSPLAVSARVVWIKRSGGHFLVGLEFEGLRSDDRERIEGFAHAATDDGKG